MGTIFPREFWILSERFDSIFTIQHVNESNEFLEGLKSASIPEDTSRPIDPMDSERR